MIVKKVNGENKSYGLDSSHYLFYSGTPVVPICLFPFVEIKVNAYGILPSLT